MDEEAKVKVTDCLLAIRSGDDKSVEELYNLISPTIRYIALKYLKDVSNANDLVQDFWRDIGRIAHGFVFSKSGYAYLCKVMTRYALNRYKQLHNSNVKNVNFVDYENISSIEDEDNLEKVEIRILIEGAMNQLSETEKIVIQSTYYQNKTLRGIAKELGVSKTQVGRIRQNAIETMKKYIVETRDKQKI